MINCVHGGKSTDNSSTIPVSRFNNPLLVSFKIALLIRCRWSSRALASVRDCFTFPSSIHVHSTTQGSLIMNKVYPSLADFSSSTFLDSSFSPSSSLSVSSPRSRTSLQPSIIESGETHNPPLKANSNVAHNICIDVISLFFFEDGLQGFKVLGDKCLQ